MESLEIAQKTFPDGRWAYVVPLTFGRGRINVAPPDDRYRVKVCY